jgi:hypothetical protein
LKGDKHKILTKDVRIDYRKQWQKLHRRGIESAYKSSPFYEYYIDNITGFFNKKYEFLFDYNMEILSKIQEMLDLKVRIEFSDEFITDAGMNFDDFRDLIHPKKSYGIDLSFSPVPYSQVFSNKYGFIPNLSILDLIFNEGPDTVEVLKKSIVRV